MTALGQEGLLDSDQMFAATAGMPDQLMTAAQKTRDVELSSIGQPSSIVMIGMGGSAVAGEVVAALGAPHLDVPVVEVNSYELPHFVDESTLAFAVSFSGETEETIAAVTEAIERGARIVAITSGGRLAELCREHHLPVCLVPAQIPQPRAALGACLGSMLVVMERLSLLAGGTAMIEAAVRQLRTRRDELTRESSMAHEIARQIDRRFPFIYGAYGIGAVAARRWKTQINENAKTPAFFAVHPEACHNEIVGYGQAGDVTRQIFTMVQLRSDYEHPRAGLRFDLVEDALREVMGGVIDVHAKGDGPLAQVLDLMMIGDYVSLQMAVSAGVDPGPVPLLGEIKAALRSTR